ncbi:ATP-dependent RNA helicase HrpA [Tessaracoccus sp. OS52]|nr:ATP-dependent RNA helicase HrpA [Tessaracoccus sp. OS52]MCC2593116.1 ATP-dependent RNA helicase HrpA [Tessaracoccus sp. OS52]
MTQTHTPRLEFDPALPITAEVPHIAALIRDNQVVVVAGETGSGKTTQLPKICLLAGRERIAHTQPRRIAARTVAQRIADECDVEIGEFVGYQVRFTRKVTRATRIKVMTDGVLLSELAHDRDLRRYDTIIIDEAHERSLNIDFLLGYLKQLLVRRPDLRVIVTSATIDTARFSQHFSDAPVVEVSGRTYPVEVRYRPVAEDRDEVDAIADAVAEIATESGTGDVLVFLSGEREIRDAADAVSALGLDWDILPLFARLSAADQQRVFQNHTRRRVVLATNVAETSITVPGIRYVVDVGNARISRYSARTKVQRLPIEPVSQASANQRAGRCGRLGPGIAIRLYSEDDYESRPRFTEPEILRTNLATVILLMAQAGLGDVESFPFVEAPETSQINDGLRVLSELGAISPRKRHEQIRLTRTGRLLAQMPVDPRLGRMLLEGSRRGCLDEVQVLVAALTVPDVRERPADHQQAADVLHRRFWEGVPGQVAAAVEAPSTEPLRHTVHTGTRKEPSRARLEGGDFEVLLNVWNYLRARRKELSGNAFRRMCREEYLHFVRFREWEDLVSQLREVSKELELKRGGGGAMPEILTSLLSGLLSHVGLAETERSKPVQGRRKPLTEYQGARGARFAIQPGSSCARSTPPLVMAYELVETSRLWARTVAPIKPEWVEAVGAHVITRTMSEPHWQQRTGTVVASETVTLFGVPLISGRRVGYAAREPEQARQIFIRTALVEGEWETWQDVVVANRFAMAEAQRLTDRMRRPDLLIPDDALYDFYDARIPADVHSAATLDKWLRSLADDSFLRLTPADCMVQPGAVSVSDFPDRWQVDGHSLPITYVFDPGAGHDGVTVEVPLELLPQLDGAPFSWQVPGLRAELATGLLRSLPKQVRTRFVPAPDWATKALGWLDEHPGPEGEDFTAALARALLALTGERVQATDWNRDALESHLRPTFIVSDGTREVARGPDLDRLRVDLAPRVRSKLNRSAKRITATGQTSWTFGTIPVSVELGHGVVGHPALVDEGATVGVAVADSAERAHWQHALGLRRLLVCTNPSPVRSVVAHMSNSDKLALGSSEYPSVQDLLADAWLKASGQLMHRLGDPDRIRDAEAYARLADLVRQDCAPQTQEVVRVAARALATAAEARRQLERFQATDPVRLDVTEQLANLTFNKFISSTPDPWYERLPAYVQAVVVRLENALKNPARDQRARHEVEEMEALYAQLCDAQPPGPLPPPVEEVGFLIEELRISLFAQGVRTAVPVSAKRIRQAIAAAGAAVA